jgi:hypothetical protein
VVIYGRGPIGHGVPKFCIKSAEIRGLVFDMRLVHQQNRDIVAHRVDTVTRPALQLVFIFVISQRGFADGASEDLEQVSVDHSDSILLRKRSRGTDPLQTNQPRFLMTDRLTD